MTPRTSKPTPEAELVRQSAGYDVWKCDGGELRMIPAAGTPDPDLVGMFADKFREREAVNDAVRSAPSLASLYPKEIERT